MLDRGTSAHVVALRTQHPTVVSLEGRATERIHSMRM
jgi:hypothetical protein